MSGNFFRLRGADGGMLVPVPVICNIHVSGVAACAPDREFSC